MSDMRHLINIINEAYLPPRAAPVPDASINDTTTDADLASLGRYLGSETDPSDDPESSAFRQQVRRTIDQAVEGLPEMQSRALRLWMEHDGSLDDLVAILGINRERVRTLLRQAARELRKNPTLKALWQDTPGHDRWYRTMESQQSAINEVDVSRRNLFKGAAAMAAVAAIPAPIKAQAVELIKDRGPEFLQVVIDAIKHGITRKDINYVDEFGYQYFGEHGQPDPHPLDIFPNNKRRAAIQHITGIDPGEDTHVPVYDGDPDEDGEDYEYNSLPDWEKRMRDIMRKMTDDQKFELLRKTWQAVGLGSDPGFYHWYMMKKRYPEIARMHVDYIWDMLRDFLPASWGSKGNEGIASLQQMLARARENLANNPDPYGVFKHDVDRLEKMIRDHGAASKMLGGKAAAPAAAKPGNTATASVSTRNLLSPVLRAVDIMFRALRTANKIPDSTLDVLADINPENIRVGMGEPATGKKPEAPAALPAPGVTMPTDLGTARGREAAPVGRTQAG